MLNIDWTALAAEEEARVQKDLATWTDARRAQIAELAVRYGLRQFNLPNGDISLTDDWGNPVAVFGPQGEIPEVLHPADE